MPGYIPCRSGVCMGLVLLCERRQSLKGNRCTVLPSQALLRTTDAQLQRAKVAKKHVSQPKRAYAATIYMTRRISEKLAVRFVSTLLNSRKTTRLCPDSRRLPSSYRLCTEVPRYSDLESVLPGYWVLCVGYCAAHLQPALAPGSCPVCTVWQDRYYSLCIRREPE